MGFIETVNGRIPRAKLGTTIMHEHLWLKLTEDQTLNDIDKVAEELSLYKELGGNSVVDVANWGMGRNVKALKELSDKTGLHVIASTGFYFEKYYPEFALSTGIDELADFMVREINEGIDGTQIKAGLIAELGTSDPITEAEVKVFTAAAAAQKTTGVPISTHTPLGKHAVAQAEMLLEQGVDPDRIIIGHVDLISDLDYHLQVAETGCNIQYDTFGKEQFIADKQRISNLVEMLSRGYEDKIVLSQDVTRKTYFKTNGGFGYQHVLGDVVPALREHGVPENVIKKMLVDNPARILEVRK